MSATNKLSWGILGTGNIADTFAQALAECATGELVAVASRKKTSAEAFGEKFDAPGRYSQYDDLLADPGVDVVYISLPNHMHVEWAVRCARAGKHILCEKPLATNAAEAQTLVAAARDNGVYLLEAFMYRCHPQTAKLVELVRSGVIGEVRVIEARFGYNMGLRMENIRLSNSAAGGAIMDVGCYCVSAARLVAGAATGVDVAEPIDVHGVAHIGAGSRVDEWATAVLRFPGEIVANVTCASQVQLDNDLRIWGSAGNIRVPNPWFPGKDPERSRIIVHKADAEPEEFIVTSEVGLYAHEADTVAATLSQGQASAPAMTWADSLGNMKTLDRWRDSVGLSFDNEGLDRLTRPFSGKPLRRRDNHRMLYGHVDGLDIPISRMVMGSMIYGPQNMPFVCSMLDYFVELGGNAIDTAWVYGGGDSERAVGNWMKLRNNRDDIVILGKGGHTPDCYPEGIAWQIHDSLRRLQTDYIDLYMLHRDNLELPVSELIDCLNENRRAGRIRAYGVSNWTTERIQEANEYAAANKLVGLVASSPNVALARWNEPTWRDCISASDPASREWYRAHQMPVFAWSSQAGGFFSGRFGPEDRGDPAAADAVRVWFNADNFRRLERARELAAAKDCDAVQIAVAYVLCQDFPVFSLIGPRDLDEIRTSLQGLDISLTAEERAWLNLETEEKPL